jgi:hypothetical protein
MMTMVRILLAALLALALAPAGAQREVRTAHDLRRALEDGNQTEVYLVNDIVLTEEVRGPQPADPAGQPCDGGHATRSAPSPPP